MTRQERLDIGEKIIVGAFIGAIAVETLLTAFALTLTSVPGSSWSILLLGVLFVGVLVYLANWIYSGNLNAWTASLGWAALQIALAVSVLVAFTVNRHPPSFVAYVGLPVLLLAVLKAITYVLFAGSLAVPVSVRDFLGLRRGEPVHHDEPAPTLVATEPPPASAPLALTDPQAAAFGSLATWMQVAAGVLVVAGVLRLLVGLVNIEPVADYRRWLPGLPNVIEGLILLALGIILCAPATAVKEVESKEANSLTMACERLQGLYFTQMILTALAVVAVLIGIGAIALKLI